MSQLNCRLPTVLAFLAGIFPASAQDRIVMSREEIADHPDSDIAFVLSNTLVTQIANQIVYVDWHILPGPKGDELPSTTEACSEIVNLNPPLGDRTFSFSPYGNADVVVVVAVGNPAVFPLNGLDCQLVEDGVNYSIRLRGVYLVSFSQQGMTMLYDFQPAEVSEPNTQQLRDSVVEAN